MWSTTTCPKVSTTGFNGLAITLLSRSNSTPFLSRDRPLFASLLEVLPPLLPPPFRVGVTLCYKPELPSVEGNPDLQQRANPTLANTMRTRSGGGPSHTSCISGCYTDVNSRIHSPLQCAPSSLKRMRSKSTHTHSVAASLQCKNVCSTRPPALKFILMQDVNSSHTAAWGPRSLISPGFTHKPFNLLRPVPRFIRFRLFKSYPI